MIEVGEASPGIVAESAAERELVDFPGESADFQVCKFAVAVPVIAGFFGFDLGAVDKEICLRNGVLAECNENPFARFNSFCAGGPRLFVTCGVRRAFVACSFCGDVIKFYDKALVRIVAERVFVCFFKDGLLL